MNIFTSSALIVTATCAVTFTAHTFAQDADATPATSNYDFMVGEWDLEAGTMQPNQTIMPGEGTVNVYWVHDGQTLQADMQVEFENGSGFYGSTLRTYDHANENWALVWAPAGGQANAGATAVWDEEGERMVETWPASQDQMGPFQDQLIVFDITEDRFVVSMDRQYVNGPKIEGVWRYVATRR